jgi:hypothetical protein
LGGAVKTGRRRIYDLRRRGGPCQMSEYILEPKKFSKHFSGMDVFSFGLRPGEVHILPGANGCDYSASVSPKVRA